MVLDLSDSMNEVVFDPSKKVPMHICKAVFEYPEGKGTEKWFECTCAAGGHKLRFPENAPPIPPKSEKHDGRHCVNVRPLRPAAAAYA